jgi:hypothetical protein
VEKQELLHKGYGDINIIATTEKSMGSLKQLKVELLCDPAIPLLGIHPKEMKLVF